MLIRWRVQYFVVVRSLWRIQFEYTKGVSWWCLILQLYAFQFNLLFKLVVRSIFVSLVHNCKSWILVHDLRLLLLWRFDLLGILMTRIFSRAWYLKDFSWLVDFWFRCTVDTWLTMVHASSHTFMRHIWISMSGAQGSILSRSLVSIILICMFGCLTVLYVICIKLISSYLKIGSCFAVLRLMSVMILGCSHLSAASSIQSWLFTLRSIALHQCLNGLLLIISCTILICLILHSISSFDIELGRTFILFECCV